MCGESTIAEQLNRLDQTLRFLECRMDHIDAQIHAPAPKTKDWWDKSQIIATILTPVIAGVFGYLLITTVNLSLQKQQLQLSGAKEMQGLLADLGNPGAPLEKAEASAVALSSFGRFAIVPLINELQAGTLNRQVAAQVGLRAIGVEDPDETCGQLIQTIRNRSRLYSWITHRYALHLLGDLNCQQAMPFLVEYKQILGLDTQESVKSYSSVVADETPPSLENLRNLRSEVERSIQILSAQTPH